MPDILLFWIGLVVGFIIIEFFTATFYGFALSLAAAVVGVYVYLTHATDFQMLHAVIFVLASAIFAYTLPKYLVSGSPDTPQGSDRYIGEKRVVKKSWWDLKISLDGVEYLIESTEEVVVWDKVEILWHKGISMKVKKVIDIK